MKWNGHSRMGGVKSNDNFHVVTRYVRWVEHLHWIWGYLVIDRGTIHMLKVVSDGTFYCVIKDFESFTHSLSLSLPHSLFSILWLSSNWKKVKSHSSIWEPYGLMSSDWFRCIRLVWAAISGGTRRSSPRTGCHQQLRAAQRLLDLLWGFDWSVLPRKGWRIMVCLLVLFLIKSVILIFGSF